MALRTVCAAFPLQLQDCVIATIAMMLDVFPQQVVDHARRYFQNTLKSLGTSQTLEPDALRLIATRYRRMPRAVVLVEISMFTLDPVYVGLSERM